ncbi:MAG: FprA family A-type flavoprotein [Oscillospiraceae bacterium]
MEMTLGLARDLSYVGVNDRTTPLFENLFPIPKGVSYNSYLLTDEKTVLLDTVDASGKKQFLENLAFRLGDRTLDYLIISHMEPDHCATIQDILALYPEITLVGNAKTFGLLHRFFSLSPKELVVEDGDVLDTGSHILRFMMAPMVHWPEVMVTYDETEKILFSADAFGTFGAVDGSILADRHDYEREFLAEARRYFTNIVGKYGAQAAALLEKAQTLPLMMVCPLHGPVLQKDIGLLLQKQLLWSNYEPEFPEDFLIVYASMYGNTESIANAVAVRIGEEGLPVRVINICNTDKSHAIAEMFRVAHIILACPTYNGGIFPAMEALLLDMKALNLQNRTVNLIENGSWAPTAGRKMQEILSTMKNITQNVTLTIPSALRDEEQVEHFITNLIQL